MEGCQDGLSRRRALELLGAGGVAALAGCNQRSGGASRSTSTPTTPVEVETRAPGSDAEWEVEPVEHDGLVGAHYYLWYKSEPGWMDWLDHVPATPVLGEYASASENVVNHHVKWALEHGINWFNVSWWGPDSDEDAILRERFLGADLADRMTFSLLYEPVGRFDTNEGGEIDFDRPENRRRLRREFRYAAESFFGRENYLTVDGRPVVYVYGTSRFAGGVAAAFREAREATDADPYLIADLLNGGSALLRPEWAEAFDAVTAYNVFAFDVAPDLDVAGYAAKRAGDWSLAAGRAGLDFVPTVMPGYNDALYRHAPALERSPERFRDLAERVRQRTDPDLDAVLVTSFNEWPEYTAVEPSEGYGLRYLRVVREVLAEGEPARSTPDPDRYDTLRIEFDRTVRPMDVDPEAGDDRHLALLLSGLELHGEVGATVASYDVGVPTSEPYIVGTYAPERSEDGSRTWRWLGGSLGRTTVYLDPDLGTLTGATLVGSPMVSEGIEADVYFRGRRTDHVAFGERGDPEPYTVSLRPDGSP